MTGGGVGLAGENTALPSFYSHRWRIAAGLRCSALGMALILQAVPSSGSDCGWNCAGWCEGDDPVVCGKVACSPVMENSCPGSECIQECDHSDNAQGVAASSQQLHSYPLEIVYAFIAVLAVLLCCALGVCFFLLRRVRRSKAGMPDAFERSPQVRRPGSIAGQATRKNYPDVTRPAVAGPRPAPELPDADDAESTGFAHLWDEWDAEHPVPSPPLTTGSWADGDEDAWHRGARRPDATPETGTVVVQARRLQGRGLRCHQPPRPPTGTQRRPRASPGAQAVLAAVGSPQADKTQATPAPRPPEPSLLPVLKLQAEGIIESCRERSTSDSELEQAPGKDDIPNFGRTCAPGGFGEFCEGRSIFKQDLEVIQEVAEESSGQDLSVKVIQAIEHDSSSKSPQVFDRIAAGFSQMFQTLSLCLQACFLHANGAVMRLRKCCSSFFCLLLDIQRRCRPVLAGFANQLYSMLWRAKQIILLLQLQCASRFGKATNVTDPAPCGRDIEDKERASVRFKCCNVFAWAPRWIFVRAKHFHEGAQQRTAAFWNLRSRRPSHRDEGVLASEAGLEAYPKLPDTSDPTGDQQVQQHPDSVSSHADGLAQLDVLVRRISELERRCAAAGLPQDPPLPSPGEVAAWPPSAKLSPRGAPPIVQGVAVTGELPEVASGVATSTWSQKVMQTSVVLAERSVGLEDDSEECNSAGDAPENKNNKWDEPSLGTLSSLDLVGRSSCRTRGGKWDSAGFGTVSSGADVETGALAVPQSQRGAGFALNEEILDQTRATSSREDAEVHIPRVPRSFRGVTSDEMPEETGPRPLPCSQRGLPGSEGGKVPKDLLKKFQHFQRSGRDSSNRDDPAGCARFHSARVECSDQLVEDAGFRSRRAEPDTVGGTWY